MNTDMHAMSVLSSLFMARNLSLEFQYLIARQGIFLCSMTEHMVPQSAIMDRVQRYKILCGLACVNVLPRY